VESQPRRDGTVMAASLLLLAASALDLQASLRFERVGQGIGTTIKSMLAASNCRKEVAAWQQKRNAAVVKVHWQFATADARIRLKKL